MENSQASFAATLQKMPSLAPLMNLKMVSTPPRDLFSACSLVDLFPVQHTAKTYT